MSTSSKSKSKKIYPRDSKGRFTSNTLISVGSATTNIYGDIEGNVFNHPDRGGRYFLVVDTYLVYCYNPVSGKSYTPNKSYRLINRDINFGLYKEIPYKTLQKEFPNNMDRINKILEVENQEQKIVAEQPKEETKTSKLELSDIKNGSLYFNIVEFEVQRVIDVVGNLIYTSYHKSSAIPYGRSSLRLATTKEVSDYLKEAKELEDIED